MISEPLLTEGLEELTTEDSEVLLTEGADNPFLNDYGVKITKKGKSITSTDPRDYILWSKYPVLKVAQSGGGTFLANTWDGPWGATLTINHNLGYNPIVFFFKKKTSTGIIGPDLGKIYAKSNFQDTFAYAVVINDASDKNNIYIYFGIDSWGSEGTTYNYYYYLCYDEGINI